MIANSRKLMNEPLYKDEVFNFVGTCREVPGEPGKGQDKDLYKDAFTVELQRAQIPFVRERKCEVIYKGVNRLHHDYADFVVRDQILFEAKAFEGLTEVHGKQVLNYLAISRLELGLLINFGADSLEWKRVALSRTKPVALAKDFRL